MERAKYNEQRNTIRDRLHALRFAHFVPFLCALACGIAAVIIYTLTEREHVVSDYMAALGGACILWLVPVFPLVFRKELPQLIRWLIFANVVFATSLGTTLHVYDKLGWWDLFVHGLFGFLATTIAFWLITDSEHIKMHPVCALLIAVAVAMACGALWEICEYCADLIFDGDTQRVAESIAAGKSPLADTMGDLMITLAGSAVFAILFAIDTLLEHKIFFSLRILRDTKKKPSDGRAPSNDALAVPNDETIRDNSRDESPPTH